MIARAVAVAVLVAGVAGAQLSTSPNFRLDSAGLGGAGGGTCSPALSLLAGQDAGGDDDAFTSAGFRAQVGFLTIYDVDVDQPGLFALAPGFGTVAGGTAITLCGVHFERGGLAGPVTVDIGGQPATSVVVLSDSTVTAVAPPGAFGPADVTLTTAFGTAVAAGGFVFTPGLVTSSAAWLTGSLRVANYGPAGASFQTLYSTNTASIPLPPFGTLLIGPAPLFEAVGLSLYPSPDGVAVKDFPVPANPVLTGVVFHFQSVAILSLAPLDVRLLNRSSTLFQ